MRRFDYFSKLAILNINVVIDLQDKNLMRTEFIKALSWCILIISCACGCSQAGIISYEQAGEYYEQIGRMLPDSLKTPGQLLINEKLTETIYEKVQVRNNRMVLNVDRDYVIGIGLPSFCYDLIKYELENINRTVRDYSKTADGHHKIDIAEAYRESHEEYRRLGLEKYLERQDSLKRVFGQ